MPGEHPAPTLRTLIAPFNAALDALWHLCARRSTAAVLMAPLLLALALGPVLLQAPWTLAAEPSGLGHWLARLQMQWGPWLAGASLASLYATRAFRLLLAAVGFGALVATVDRWLAWRAREVKGFPWHTLAHVGLLLLLAGMLADEHWGWQQERLLVAGDSPVPVGPTNGALYLQQAPEPDAAWGDVSLQWQRGDVSGTGEVRQSGPIRLGATTVHLLQHGPAVRLRLTDAAGSVLPLDDPATGSSAQPEATLRYTEEGESRYVSVPSRDWVIRVTRNAEVVGAPPFTLWVYRGLDATPLAQTSLTGEDQLQVADVGLHWQVLPYADVRAAFQPGLPLWAGGWALLCLGVLLPLLGQAHARRATIPRLGRLLWLAAALPVGAWAQLEAGQFVVQETGRVARVGGLVLAWAAALLLLASLTGLLAGLKWRRLAWWREAPGWALLIWLAGGGVMTAANWAAGGALWEWTPRQAGWALVCCLLVGAWHRGRERGRWEPVLEAGIAAFLAAAVAVLMG